MERIYIRYSPLVSSGVDVSSYSPLVDGLQIPHVVNSRLLTFWSQSPHRESVSRCHTLHCSMYRKRVPVGGYASGLRLHTVSVDSRLTTEQGCALYLNMSMSLFEKLE